MNTPIKRTVALGLGLATTAVAAGAAGYTYLAGPKSDGTAVTPIGMRVTPYGSQTTLGDLPLNQALSPDGNLLAVSNDGQGTQSLQLVDTHDGDVTSTIAYKTPETLYMGLAWSADGKRLYASAAGNAKIRVYDVANGKATETASIAMPTKAPSGAALNLYPAGLAITPDGKTLVVADQLADAVSTIDLASGTVRTVPAGHRPLFVTVASDGRTAYVTNQGASDVSVVDLTRTAPRVTGTLKAGLHPNKALLSADSRTLFVANGDDDTVSAINLDTRKQTRIRLSDALVGSNPTGLALNDQGTRLFVTNSGDNDVAVVNTANGKVTGTVPVGWYPTSVSFVRGKLLVTNGKGLGAGPNNGPGHPDPTSSAPTAENQYSGSMIQGTLSRFDVPTTGKLRKLSDQVATNNKPVMARGNIIPTRIGQASPIKHVIYVVKENRTYDQVFGSLGKGNGDPSLNLFGDDVMPNIRNLARTYTTFDNFYADAEVSANGWNWVAQANSNPYAEQMWPSNYSGRKAPYPSEDTTVVEDAAQKPSDAYIWQRLDDANISLRNYGFYSSNASDGTTYSTDPVLDANTDRKFRAWDLGCPDSSGTFKQMTAANLCTPRVDEWIKDFSAQAKAGTMPTVQFVRFGTDHTQGTKAGAPTPQAYVADNDLAVGRLVDTVSHSPLWKDTAIFITEDDAQNGPDHVDAHRTEALVVSPWTRTGRVDSTFYSTASMLHTMELVVGIGPMTQFDRFATPMSHAFSSTADYTPWTAQRPTYDMTTVNAATAPLAAASSRQSTTKEDTIDEQTFNQAIWKSVKGANSTMPAPQHHVLGAGVAPTSGDADGDGK